MKMVDYESDVTIDEDALDVEWLRQAMLMGRYGRLAVEARRVMDLTKERLDVVRAELDRDIRANPAKYGIEKVTEGVVQNTIILAEKVRTDEEKKEIAMIQPYQDAVRAFIDAKYESEMAQAAVRAVDQKKSALENLVRLHGQQYFAGPSVPRDLSREWERSEQQRRADESAKMKTQRSKKEMRDG